MTCPDNDHYFGEEFQCQSCGYDVSERCEVIRARHGVLRVAYSSYGGFSADLLRVWIGYELQGHEWLPDLDIIGAICDMSKEAGLYKVDFESLEMQFWVFNPLTEYDRDSWASFWEILDGVGPWTVTVSFVDETFRESPLFGQKASMDRVFKQVGREE